MARRRAPLTKQRVLRAAVALADEHGLDALSMRRLGHELGVEAMSLYNHVANKDEILDGIVELIAEEVELPQPGSAWQPAMRQLAVSFRQLFLRHRWANGIWMSPGGIGGGRMRLAEAMLRTLREGGFSDDLAYRGYHVLQAHVLGYVSYQLGFPYKAEELVALGQWFLQTISADEFPYLIEHVRQHLDAQLIGESDFEFGLDLILDGLERIRAAEANR